MPQCYRRNIAIISNKPKQVDILACKSKQILYFSETDARITATLFLFGLVFAGAGQQLAHHGARMYYCGGGSWE